MFLHTPTQLKRISLAGIWAGKHKQPPFLSIAEPHLLLISYLALPKIIYCDTSFYTGALIQHVLQRLPSFTNQRNNHKHPAVSLQHHKSLRSLETCKVFTRVPDDQSVHCTMSTLYRLSPLEVPNKTHHMRCFAHIDRSRDWSSSWHTEPSWVSLDGVDVEPG